MSFDEKKYRIDKEPVSANELIKRASYYDEEYASSFLKATSRGAMILRNNGHIVDDNPDYKPSDE